MRTISGGSIRDELAVVEGVVRPSTERRNAAARRQVEANGPMGRNESKIARGSVMTEAKGANDAVEKAAQALGKAAMDATKADDPNTGTALQMISSALMRLAKGDLRGTADALEQATGWVQKLPAGTGRPAAAASATPADDVDGSEPTDDEVMECFGLREDRETTEAAMRIMLSESDPAKGFRKS